jgi:hypothetical protein
LQSRNGEYLQIVENYRDEGRVRQRLVMYVGHYTSIDDALRRMARELSQARRRATVAEGYPAPQDEAPRLREEANRLAAKLEDLRRFADGHPDVVDRDRVRAERHAERWRERVRQLSAERRRLYPKANG